MSYALITLLYQTFSSGPSGTEDFLLLSGEDFILLDMSNFLLL